METHLNRHRFARAKLTATGGYAIFAAALFSATPALPQGPALDTAASSEIERFCTNIADPARDRRYALQARELEALQAEIDQRIRQLEEKRAEYQAWMEKREAFIALAEGNVVEIYASMRPDAAAERMEQLRGDLAAAILMKLDARKAGVILNEMESKSAAVLTGIMAAAARSEDPS
jgi:flagellar motility protein MotE (MotC chaperone)